MTSGSKTVGSLSTSGPYYAKTWSGTDSPPQSKQKPPRLPDTIYTALVRNKKGQVVEVLRRHKGRIDRPRKRARSLTPHDYSATIVDRYISDIAYYRATDPPGSPWFTRKSNTPLASVSGDLTFGANEVISIISDLKSRINGGADFDASVFLGTGHQSLQTISEAAIKIAQALRDLRKGRISDAARTLTGTARGPSHRPVRSDRALSQEWLGLQYGWLPLVKDMYESGTFLASLLNDPFVFRVRVRKRKRSRVITGPDNGSGNAEARWSESDAFATYQILALLSESPSNVFRLGLTNPANLAWELLPWSFVIDWAIPIGDYLNARGVASSLKGTFISTQTSKLSASGVSAGVLSGGVAYLRALGPCRCTQISIVRTVSTTLAVPSPTFKPLDRVASWRHCANALALLGASKQAVRF